MDEEWWVRRAVLSALAVLGVVTTVFAVVAVGPGGGSSSDDDPADDPAPVTLPTPTASEGPLRLGDLVVVARHGSPVDLPEHTLASYEKAVADGATYLETQVVMTQDRELVVRADNELSASTDVADRPEYADRETTKTIAGVEKTGWFTEDFTLAELQGLDAVVPDPEQRPDAAAHDGEQQVLAFDDLLTRLREMWDEQDREIGLFVEPVRARYFRDIGLPVEPALSRALRRARLSIESEAVTVESDDVGVLKRMENLLGDRVLSAYVADTPEEVETRALADLPDTVDAVVVAVEAFAGSDPYELADRVHDADLALAVYPISYENALLAPGFREGEDPAGRGNLEGQIHGLRVIGADVVLAESPAEVLETLAELQQDDAATDGPTGGPADRPRGKRD